MKKILAILLAVTLLASMATMASAAENTTTLTTTVPAASYTLNIPADQQIEYGATKTNIGTVTVTESSGFATSKNLKVSVVYTPFACDNTSTEIPFQIKCPSINGTNEKNINSGSFITFYGNVLGKVSEYAVVYATTGDNLGDIDTMEIVVASDDWGKALAGEYTATITFTAEVVVEQ